MFIQSGFKLGVSVTPGKHEIKGMQKRAKGMQKRAKEMQKRAKEMQKRAKEMQKRATLGTAHILWKVLM